MSKALRIIAICGALVIGLSVLVISLPQSGWRGLSVQTGSMTPIIPQGSLVLVNRVPVSTLRIGDVITYTMQQDARKTITHRITELQRSNNVVTGVITKGDANTDRDGTIAPRQIVGRVTWHAPHAGKVLDFFKHPIGLAIFIYIPALYVIVSETLLLIKRLSELEITRLPEFVNPWLRKVSPADHPLSPHIISIGDISALRPIAKAQRRTRRPSRLGLSCMLIGLMLGAISTLSYIPKTYASLRASSTLRGNTISSVPLNQANSLLIRQLVFRCSTDNTQASNRRPRIVLYNPTNTDIVATGWYLEDNSGRMVTLPPNTRFKANKMYVVAPFLRDTGLYGLQYASDYVALKDQTSQLIDGLSWGTNSSIINPALETPSSGTRLRRIPPKRDSNAANDWQRLDKKCQKGSDDPLDSREPFEVGNFSMTEALSLED